jgi:signal peptidase I
LSFYQQHPSPDFETTSPAQAPQEPFGTDGVPLEGESPPAVPGAGRRRATRILIDVLQTIVIAALIFFAVRAIAQNFRVEGGSMEPGLSNGEYLLVNKAIFWKINLDTIGKVIPFVDGGDQPLRFLFRGPRRGDIIVFRPPHDPDRDFVKRVIGLPGDEVEVRCEDVRGSDRACDVIVNGWVLDEPYISFGGGDDFPPQKVPPGEYFVLGDNRRASFDSRGWGFVPEDNIIGLALLRYWPMEQFGGVGNRSIDLGLIRLPIP